jgi:hypothetical protein
MPTFSAAAAAALELDTSSLAHGVYAYHTALRLDVSHNANIAPSIVSILMAKMQLDEASITFTDSNSQRIDNNDLPTDKPQFDATFATATKRKSLHCHFVIHSNRTFHQVKIGIWDLLQQHRVFIAKTPGTIQKTDLVPMGFWMRVHPGFASPRAFHTQLCKDLLSKYHSTNLESLGLPATFSEPEVFFAATKCKGTLDNQALQTNALTMYGTREDFDRTTTLVTCLSTFASLDDDKSPLYVPFALKHSHPDVYGNYLAQQNEFLETHRNIAIVGLHPDAMDYGDCAEDPAFPTSLWRRISQMDGVYRVDSCRRTADLGKWNISCNSTAHPTIAQWLDTHLVDIWKQVPLELEPYAVFPLPERLSSSRGASRSVASGLTNASPVTHYLQTLASRHQPSTKITAVVRNPWRQTPPVESVQYNFNPTDYPPPGQKTDTTAQTAESTIAGTSVVTAATIQASVQDTFNAKLLEIDTARIEAEATFRSRMNDLEDSMSQVKSTLAEIADTVTAQVLIGLQVENGLFWNQNVKIDQLQAKMLELIPLVTQAIHLSTSSANPRAVSPKSPLRKNRRLEQDSPMDAVLHE